MFERRVRAGPAVALLLANFPLLTPAPGAATEATRAAADNGALRDAQAQRVRLEAPTQIVQPGRQAASPDEAWQP